MWIICWRDFQIKLSKIVKNIELTRAQNLLCVFEIESWYPVQTNNNTNNNRWGFIGKEAQNNIKAKYYNKSIMFAKKRGAANPLRFRL